MIITIDGPVATGKSTIAKQLARSLGFIYFDTGAMYRALTYAIHKEGIDYKDTKKLEDFLNDFDINIKIFRGEKTYLYKGEDVSTIIRSPEVTEHVSEIAAIPAVRRKLVELQQSLAVGVNAVFEGRDMGSTVFPDAYLKIFLTGSDEIRAERRYKELIEKFPELKETLTIGEVQTEIQKRDEFDTNREVSPLVKADDAFEVDTTDLTPEEIVFKILEFKDSIKARDVQ